LQNYSEFRQERVLKQSFIRGDRLGLAGISLLCASIAFGQEPSPAPGIVAETERVIVTGSYIPTAETESALPVTVYTSDVLQKQGANTPVEGLRQLPSFVGNAKTENDSIGGNGQANINLLALGPQNVLTLINGRRAFQYSDINAIPLGGLSRVEILKDGASSIYGSDAVAGVANFIMLNGPGERPYDGAELHALYGNTTDSDAHVRQVWLRGGVTGLEGKISIAAAGEYYSRANLFARDRDISKTADLSNNPTGLGLGGLNNNLETYAGRVSVVASGSSSGFPTGQLTLSDLTNNQVTPGSYREFEQLPGEAGTDPSRFNYRAFIPAIPAVEKAMYYVTGRYKIFGEGLQLYGDIMYSHTKQDNGLAGAAFRFTRPTDGLTEARASIFNPFGHALSSVIYRTQQELGSRRAFFDHDYHRYVAGINGDFNFRDNGFISSFGYDSGFVYESFQEQRIDSGDARRSLARQNIAPLGFVTPFGAGTGLINPFIGQFAPPVGFAPTYVNGVPTGLTAPYDNRTGFLNSSYLGHSFSFERDYLYDGKVNAHLFPNLWNKGIDLIVGGEHRQVSTHHVPDPVQAIGDSLGAGGGFDPSPNTKYKQEADSVFVEVAVPFVASTMNVPFVRSFEIAFDYRYEKFNDKDQYTHDTATFDNGGAPRIMTRYQPSADLALRASWSKSFRSPAPPDLFDPPSHSFAEVFDPLKRELVEPALGTFLSGNRALAPERTDAYSAGIVLTPRLIPGFTMTLDVYQLFTRGVILDAGTYESIILTLNARSGGVLFADQIIRDDMGNLQGIDATTNNAGKRLVEGLDLTAVYEIPTQRFGKFTLSGGYNHFFIWKAEAVDGRGTTTFLGNYNNGSLPLAPGAIPWNKGFLRGEWEWRGFDFVVTCNYVGDFNDDSSFIAEARQIGGTDANPEYDLHRRVPSYITLDMQLSYEWKKPVVESASASSGKDGKNVMTTSAEASSSTIWQRMLWGTTLTVGVNDAFDRNPPTALAASNGNYDTSLYSIRNRYYYIAFNKKF
jgi:iron complex outermembrane recepter protein